MYEVLIPVVVGAALGLIASFGLDWHHRRLRSKGVLKGIAVELASLKVRLAASQFHIRMRLGTLDRGHLLRIQHLAEQYTGTYLSPELQRSVDHLLKDSDEDIKATVQNNAREKAELAIGLKGFTMPLLEAHLSDIPLLRSDLQVVLVEIVAHLRALNEEIAQGQRYYQLTLEPDTMAVNAEVLKRALSQSYRAVDNGIEQLLGRIEEYEKRTQEIAKWRWMRADMRG